MKQSNKTQTSKRFNLTIRNELDIILHLANMTKYRIAKILLRGCVLPIRVA